MSKEVKNEQRMDHEDLRTDGHDGQLPQQAHKDQADEHADAEDSVERAQAEGEPAALDKEERRREVNINMDVSEKERDAVMAMRRVESLREGNGIVGDVIHKEGSLTVTRYIGGHHPQYAVYDGSQMICLCVYKKGAMALVEYINKMKGTVK